MKRLLIHLFLALMAGGLPGSACLAQPAVKTFTFAVVPRYDARTLYDTWQPVMDRLEAATGHHFVLDTSPDIPTFEKRFYNGIYDFVYANPLQYITAANLQGYRALLRDGGRNLQGIVVVRKDSVIKRIEQLDGQAIAFPSPNALGASLMVRYELSRLHGITFDPQYVKTHSSAYLQVATGRFPAAGGVVGTLLQQAPELRERLRIIYRTQEIKPHPIAAHPRVDADTAAKVTQAFMDLAQTPSGRALLTGISFAQPTAISAADYQNLEYFDLGDFK